MLREPASVGARLFPGVAVMALLLTPFACGHGRLLLASNARVVPGATGFAVVEQDGVRVAASGDDWTARPLDLSHRMTPLKVRIVNHSGQELQILYDRFSLAGGGGRVYRPLPSMPLLHEPPVDATDAVHPYFAFESFFVRQAYRDMYPSLPPWPTRIRGDDEFYRRQYSRWTDDLPTRDMRRLSLPEGVLADGGEMTGFLFFENATDGEHQVLFDATFKDGRGDRTVTSIKIPFRVE